ncbi:MAG: FtsK/SpoIIIE domain-containing protein, partial [Clostridia bacterium]
IVLDIHEKFHGPHVLIAGSTGSGKSEFIITYILSLAINYHPDDVTVIIIDYKGGDVAGAFQKREVKLPHLVGIITNIDTVGLQRALASIKSELKRRQILFNEAKNKIDEGTLDIYKYQKLYHEGILSEPIPHLLIICDEFAELKQQQSDFMQELISVARIGRSLGVHLILATQKPAGIVDEQIRSNSKFSVCLKVQDRNDSLDVIKRPDAAYLRSAGQFYLQVGNSDYFTLGLAAWSGAPYIPSDIIKKSVDSSIKFISDIGSVIKEVGVSKNQLAKSEGEQLTNIVKYMYELAKRENIHSKPLWLENIPEIIFISQLKKKYKVTKTPNVISPVIGEFDDPYNQRQGIVELNLSNQGNTIIYGNAESGKETLLSTIVYDIMTTYTAQEAQMYLLDFGSEALKIFQESPSVGDVVFLNDTEKMRRLFDMLQKEVKLRTAILSDYNGDYNLYIKTSGNIMPTIIVIINNYEAFCENYENDYDDTLLSLTRDGLKCGITFLITVSSYNAVRYRLAQNFKQKIALQLNSSDDYMNIFSGIGKKRPSNIFGRGLVKLEDIYEFQTAKICEPEKWNLHINEVIDKLKRNAKTEARKIPILPEVVSFDDVKAELKDLSSVPIGITKKDLEIFTYNFKKDFITIITSRNIDIATQFLTNILQEIKQLNNVNVILMDAERIIQTGKIDLDYLNFVSKLSVGQTSDANTLCIIIGLDKFINTIDNSERGFYALLKKAEELKNYNFIIVENFTRLKSHEYNEWYKNYISGDSGIWVGNGISDQYLISVNITDRNGMNKCGKSFGHVIKREEATTVKLLGMKEEGGDVDG